jgi:hypothetical protein
MSNDKLAQEALDQIMEQAQVFASAWSLVGGPFDSGSALDDANDAKDELRTMVRSLATLAAEAEKQAGPVASDKEDAELFRWLLIAHDWGICEWDERESQWVRDSRSASVVRDAIRAACNPTAIRALLQRMDEAEAEVQEQARLNGMGAERELAPRARLDEAEKALQWRPIETAPENTEREVVVQWIDSDGAICRDLDYREDGCWMGWHNHAEHVEMIGGHGVSYTPPYTNWMPLPPAPKG